MLMASFEHPRRPRSESANRSKVHWNGGKKEAEEIEEEDEEDEKGNVPKTCELFVKHSVNIERFCCTETETSLTLGKRKAEEKDQSEGYGNCKSTHDPEDDYKSKDSPKIDPGLKKSCHVLFGGHEVSKDKAASLPLGESFEQSADFAKHNFYLTELVVPHADGMRGMGEKVATATSDLHEDEGPPPAFKVLHRNVYIHRSHRVLDGDEVSVCECKYTKGDPQSACGPDRCINALLNTECTPGYCPCGERCLNQRFQRCQYPKAEVKGTRVRGWGLFASENIKAGQFVQEYCGEVIGDTEAHRRAAKYVAEGEANAYILMLSGTEFVDATRQGAYARFLNHSCAPNCEARKWTVLGEVRVGVFARVDIPSGAELMWDYNFEWYGGEKVRCRCGTPSCVGFLGAKSRAFQEDAYLWEDDDGRYQVDNVPTYDSDDDYALPVSISQSISSPLAVKRLAMGEANGGGKKSVSLLTKSLEKQTEVLPAEGNDTGEKEDAGGNGDVKLVAQCDDKAMSSVNGGVGGQHAARKVKLKSNKEKPRKPAVKTGASSAGARRQEKMDKNVRLGGKRFRRQKFHVEMLENVLPSAMLGLLKSAQIKADNAKTDKLRLHDELKVTLSSGSNDQRKKQELSKNDVQRYMTVTKAARLAGLDLAYEVVGQVLVHSISRKSNEVKEATVVPVASEQLFLTSY